YPSPVRRGDRTVRSLQIVRADTETARRRREQSPARLCACCADRAPALLDRLTAECVLLVRSSRGVGGDHADLLEPDVELLRRDLSKGGEDPLTKLGLAGEDRDRLVRLQADPPLQSAMAAQAERQGIGR